MRYLALVVLNIIIIGLKAQTSESIIAELKIINTAIANKDCNINTAVISNRAMNVFLADKTSYLSCNVDDLSRFTNFVTFNSAEGKITINHNIENTSGVDEPIKTLFSIGASATLGNQLSATFLNNSYETAFGGNVNYKWLGKVSTYFKDCDNSNHNNQKQMMDALRIGNLHALETEIRKREANFKTSLNTIKNVELPNENIDSAKAIISRNFYTDLKAEFEEKFAKQQAEILSNTNNFKLITTSWTGINLYVPIVAPKYAVAQSFKTVFQNKYTYPLAVTLSHTHFWESSTIGRIFLTLSGNLLLNNSKLSYGLDKTNYSDYLISGGTDTSNISALKNNKAFIGDFKTFFTPTLKFRFVYYPLNAHFGIAFSLEQNFGTYNPLNGKITVPIVLINSKKLAAVNFNFDVLLLDITNNYSPIKKASGKTIIGVEIGIPFSRLMF